MTNAELIATIRKEIISRIDKRHLSEQAKNELGKQSGSSEIPNDLEEAAIDFADNARKQLYSKDYAISSIADYDHGCIDGFRAGAKWQAEQLLKSSPLPEDTVLFNKGVAEGKRLAEEEQADLLTIAHLLGADQMKEQMMKGAVECIVEDWNPEPHPEITIPLNPEEFTRGDKVRIIVCKKED